MPARQPTHYATLGVAPTASDRQIRRAYRQLSKQYHPDTTTLPADEAVAMFHRLNEAYATLSQRDRRLAYDCSIGLYVSPYARHRAVRDRAIPNSNLSLADDDGLPSERPLSGGELFVLLLFGCVFAACLLLAIGMAWWHGDRLLPASFPIVSTNLTPPAVTASPSVQSRQSRALSPTPPAALPSLQENTP